MRSLYDDDKFSLFLIFLSREDYTLSATAPITVQSLNLLPIRKLGCGLPNPMHFYHTRVYSRPLVSFNIKLGSIGSKGIPVNLVMLRAFPLTSSCFQQPLSKALSNLKKGNLPVYPSFPSIWQGVDCILQSFKTPHHLSVVEPSRIPQGGCACLAADCPILIIFTIPEFCSQPLAYLYASLVDKALRISPIILTMLLHVFANANQQLWLFKHPQRGLQCVYCFSHILTAFHPSVYREGFPVPPAYEAGVILLFSKIRTIPQAKLFSLAENHLVSEPLCVVSMTHLHTWLRIGYFCSRELYPERFLLYPSSSLGHLHISMQAQHLGL